MRRRRFILSWLNSMRTWHSLIPFYSILFYSILSCPMLAYPILSYPILSYPILMSAIGCDSFAWSEKALKIRDATEDRQISKLILASKQHSKHHSMFQFETLLRSSALLRQQDSMSSLKFFICNFGTGDQSPTN
jgi:hypothetical protein